MAVRGEAGWQAVHQKAYGKDRWPGLYRAMKAPISHVSLLNRFQTPDVQARVRVERELCDMPDVPFACCSKSVASPVLEEDEDGNIIVPIIPGGVDVGPDLMQCYYLDGASVLAAVALGARPGETVLDLCAAPGGKSTVLATMLFAPSTPVPPSADAELDPPACAIR